MMEPKEPSRIPYSFLELMNLYNLGGNTLKRLDINRVITTARLLDAHEIRHGDYPKNEEVRALNLRLARSEASKEALLQQLLVMRNALETIAGSFLPDPSEPQDDQARIARQALDKALELLKVTQVP